MGSILPPGGVNDVNNAKFSQLYIYDGEEMVRRRNGIMTSLDPVVILDLHEMLKEINPFVQRYRQAVSLPPLPCTLAQIEIHRQDEDVDLQLVLTNNQDPDADPRQYNMPTAQEVAAIVPGDNDAEDADHRDIVLRTRTGRFSRIWETHSAHDPLTYPLMFPHGTNGWTYTRKQVNNIRKVLMSQQIWLI